MVEEVKEFYYLRYLLNSESGVERAVRMRVSAAWSRLRDISNPLIKKSVPLKTEPESTSFYKFCVAVRLRRQASDGKNYEFPDNL